MQMLKMLMLWVKLFLMLGFCTCLMSLSSAQAEPCSSVQSMCSDFVGYGYHSVISVRLVTTENVCQSHAFSCEDDLMLMTRAQCVQLCYHGLFSFRVCYVVLLTQTISLKASL